MTLLILTYLLISNALTLRKDKSVLFSRITLISLIMTAFIVFNDILPIPLSKDIDLFGGLFHATSFTHTFIFGFIINAFVFILISFCVFTPYNIDCDYNDHNNISKNFNFYKSIYKILKFILSANCTKTGIIYSIFKILFIYLAWYIHIHNYSQLGVLVLFSSIFSFELLILVTINTLKPKRSIRQIIEFLKKNIVLCLFGCLVFMSIRYVLLRCLWLGLDVGDCNIYFVKLYEVITLLIPTIYIVQILPETIKSIILFFRLILDNIDVIDCFNIVLDNIDRDKYYIKNIKYSALEVLFLITVFSFNHYLFISLISGLSSYSNGYTDSLNPGVYNNNTDHLSTLCIIYDSSKSTLYYFLSWYFTGVKPGTQCSVVDWYKYRFTQSHSYKNSYNSNIFDTLEKKWMLAQEKLHQNNLYEKIFLFKPKHFIYKKTFILDNTEYITYLKKLLIFYLHKELWAKYNKTVPNTTVDYNNVLMNIPPIHYRIFNEDTYDACFNNLFPNVLPYFNHRGGPPYDNPVSTPDFALHDVNLQGIRKYAFWPEWLDFESAPDFMYTKTISIQATWNADIHEVTSPSYRPLFLRQMNDPKGEDLHNLMVFSKKRIRTYMDADHVNEYNCDNLRYYWRYDITCTKITLLPDFVRHRLRSCVNFCVLLDITKVKLQTLLKAGIYIMVESTRAIILKNLYASAKSSTPTYSIVIPVSDNLVKTMPDYDAYAIIKENTESRISNSDQGEDRLSTDSQPNSSSNANLGNSHSCVWTGYTYATMCVSEHDRFI